MASKVVLLCATALFVQSVYGQVLTAPRSCGGGSGVVSGSSSNSGGPFVVTSTGAVAPRGLAASTDAMQLTGSLALEGAVPFLSAVAFDGQFATNGAAAVAYGCGDSNNIGINQEVGGSGAKLV